MYNGVPLKVTIRALWTGENYQLSDEKVPAQLFKYAVLRISGTAKAPINAKLPLCVEASHLAQALLRHHGTMGSGRVDAAWLDFNVDQRLICCPDRARFHRECRKLPVAVAESGGLES